MIGKRLDPDVLDRVEERPALVLDAARRAGRDEPHVDGQLLGHPDEEQVDVERPAVDRVDLDPADEDRAGLLAVDRQVDQRVRADVAAEQLELVGVHRDVLGSIAVAEDDGRQAARRGGPGDLLADHLARLGGEGGNPRTATSAPTNSSASLAPKPKPIIPTCCVASWFGMPKTSARSSC